MLKTSKNLQDLENTCVHRLPVRTFGNKDQIHQILFDSICRSFAHQQAELLRYDDDMYSIIVIQRSL